MALVVAIVGAAAPVLALVKHWNDSTGDNDTSQSASVTQGVVCNVAGTGNTLECTYQEVVESADRSNENHVLAEADKHRTTPPRGDGPWPFTVVRTEGTGLKARSTPVALGDQWGGIEQLQNAWVMCRRDSSFEPVPGLGSVWYKIKWDHVTPSTKFFTSQISARRTAWAYAGYLVPLNHNGDVPWC